MDLSHDEAQLYWPYQYIFDHFVRICYGKNVLYFFSRMRSRYVVYFLWNVLFFIKLFAKSVIVRMLCIFFLRRKDCCVFFSRMWSRYVVYFLWNVFFYQIGWEPVMVRIYGASILCKTSYYHLAIFMWEPVQTN
jgi:hypothetical protein